MYQLRSKGYCSEGNLTHHTQGVTLVSCQCKALPAPKPSREMKGQRKDVPGALAPTTASKPPAPPTPSPLVTKQAHELVRLWAPQCIGLRNSSLAEIALVQPYQSLYTCSPALFQATNSVSSHQPTFTAIHGSVELHLEQNCFGK